MIYHSYQPNPQETEQGVVTTAHLPLGALSVKFLCLVGT